MKKTRLQELAGLREVADKRPTELEKAKYTDEEMLTRTTANQFPTNFTILDIIERYEEYVIGYLKDQGKLNENQYGVEDIADALLEKLTSDTSLSNAGISLEGLNSQQERALSDALVNALMDIGEEYNIVF